jgi:hypothetical protein
MVLTRTLIVLSLFPSSVALSGPSSCEIEIAFERYQKAVLDGAELAEIKKYYSADLIAQLDAILNDAADHVVSQSTENAYMSTARHAEATYDHASWINGSTGCLAIDAYSSTWHHRINLVIAYTWENGEWHISDDFLAQPDNDEPWQYTGKPDYDHMCLQYEWTEIAEREVLPHKPQDAKVFFPSCQANRVLSIDEVPASRNRMAAHGRKQSPGP